MSQQNELRLDAATGLSVGARAYQEDAVLCDVPQGCAAGIAVLADGLGGHVAGALASRLAVTTVFSELAAQRDAAGALIGDIPSLMHMAAQAANHAILAHADCNPETSGMGATLLIVVVQEDHLYWLSIGDSPFYLLRDGQCEQLNEIHSLAPQFDFLARVGEMDPEVAANHPDRSCLTSALGCDPLREIDCSDTPLGLRTGDILLAASDGVLTLSEEQITNGIVSAPRANASDLADHLLQLVSDADADHQDNLSIAVLRALPAHASMPRIVAPARRGVISRLVHSSAALPGDLVGAFRTQVQPCSGPSARSGQAK